VSALMSGVMITMGFYGLARVLPLLGAPPLWWAYVLLALGAAGAVGGMLFSLAQRDVKRALAYSTVENAGVAAMAVGVGLLGTSLHDPFVAALGWTAALLHLWNHALAKSLLFLGFGAVAQRAHSRDLDALGGFLRRWRRTGAALVLGAAAIAALPGLNLFVSEWLLLRAFLAGALTLAGANRAAAIGGLVALAFAGSLALAGFARLVGVGLLGVPRTPGAAEAREPGWTMGGPTVALAVGCVAVAARPGLAVRALGAAVQDIVPNASLGAAEGAVGPLAALVPLLVAFVLIVIGVRALRSRRSPSRAGATWACAYADVTPSMQYSSTSFAGGITSVMQPLLRGSGARAAAAVEVRLSRSPWPVAAAWASATPDRVLDGVYRPLAARVARVAGRVRALHRARVTTALLYLVGALVVLLALLFLPGLGR
jgi:NADH:ubiquinone oxidoreductase subunit 5 (subunit L)/multisubunit Na+/H+ antiporter MnhA subunit